MLFTNDVITARQNRLAQNWNPILDSADAVLIFCGEPIQKPGGLDQHYNFLPHPSYFWLTGVRRPLGVMLYNKDSGWVHFINPITQAEKVWEGVEELTIPGNPLTELESYLKKKKFNEIYLLGQTPRFNQFNGVQQNESKKIKLKTTFDQTRRIKDQAEVELVERIASMANAGYKKIREVLRAGISERDLQIEYETAVYKAGALGMPYDSIVGSGTNAAILHAIPTTKIIQDGELVLIDAGAEIQDYCVDITRVYPANGKFSSQQQTIYDLVKSAQKKAMSICLPGTEWNQVHRTSAEVIAEGLKGLNILKGNTADILDSGAISVFYPHGVGHFVGLRVRDTGCEEVTQPKKYCGASLRVDVPMQENYLVTVEPGCYFIKTLMFDPEIRSKHKDFINWSEADKWENLGGVRIEDDILIQKNGPKILTAMVDK